MKGLIVQVGKPKSIVLFNNGKIQAIPTPPNCHVGMLVTVKYNNVLKIMLITLAAVFLLALGVFIGVRISGGLANAPTPEPPRNSGHMHMMERRW